MKRGYFTAACGITIYRGAAYPPAYQGNSVHRGAGGEFGASPFD